MSAKRYSLTAEARGLTGVQVPGGMFSYKKTPVICTNITLDCPGGRGTAYCKPSSGVWERGDVQVGDLELSYFLNRINLQVGQSCSEWIPQEVRISGSAKKRLLGELCSLVGVRKPVGLRNGERAISWKGGNSPHRRWLIAIMVV